MGRPSVSFLLSRYPFRSLLSDYLTALFGLGLIALPLLTLPIIPWLAGLLILIAVLFLAFFALTIIRHLTTLSVSPSQITQHTPWNKTLEWNALSFFALRCYSTRSNKGWTRLILKTPRQKLTIDSQIENFQEIVSYAVNAAYRNRLPLTSTTQYNLATLGIQLPDAPFPET